MRSTRVKMYRNDGGADSGVTTDGSDHRGSLDVRIMAQFPSQVRPWYAFGAPRDRARDGNGHHWPFVPHRDVVNLCFLAQQ